MIKLLYGTAYLLIYNKIRFTFKLNFLNSMMYLNIQKYIMSNNFGMYNFK